MSEDAQSSITNERSGGTPLKLRPEEELRKNGRIQKHSGKQYKIS